MKVPFQTIPSLPGYAPHACASETGRMLKVCHVFARARARTGIHLQRTYVQNICMLSRRCMHAISNVSFACRHCA